MKTILVAIDFSDVTPRLVETARKLAKALGSQLRLVHVLHPGDATTGLIAGPEVGIVPTAADADEPQAAERRLAELKESAAAEGVEVATNVLHGAVVQELVDETRKTGAELTVVGSHGHGAVYHLVVGSVAEGVLKKSPSDVLIVRARRD